MMKNIWKSNSTHMITPLQKAPELCNVVIVVRGEWPSAFNVWYSELEGYWFKSH